MNAAKSFRFLEPLDITKFVERLDTVLYKDGIAAEIVDKQVLPSSKNIEEMWHKAVVFSTDKTPFLAWCFCRRTDDGVVVIIEEPVKTDQGNRVVTEVVFESSFPYLGAALAQVKQALETVNENL